MTPRSAKARSPKLLLSFLGFPYREIEYTASGSPEIQMDCVFCGKRAHLYVNEEGRGFLCQRCREAGSLHTWEQAVLAFVVKQSFGQRREYWTVQRGLSEETVQRAQLGFWEPLGRFTIPYIDERSGKIINIVFRAMGEEEAKAKYLRLPHVPGYPYVVGNRSAELVVITEGEVDALSVVSTMGWDRVLAVGLPGAGQIHESVYAVIPKQSRLVAIVDNDAVGKRSATKLKDRFPGILVTTPPDGHKDVNDALVHLGEEALRSWLEGLSSQPTEQLTTTLGVRSSVYVTMPEEAGDWLIEDLWMRGSLGFLAGVPKVMKSMLALHLAYHVAEGKPFLGKTIHQKGPVILVQEEDGDRIIRQRLKKINNGKGSDNLWIVTPGLTGHHMRLDSDQSLELLDRTISGLGPVLVILDPLANLHMLEDENNAGAMNRLLERLRYIRDMRKCSFMIVHHLRKEIFGGDSPSLGQRMRGSSVLHAKSENSLYIERREGGKELLVTVESKIAPARELLIAFTGTSFTLLDESGIIEEDEYGGG